MTPDNEDRLKFMKKRKPKKICKKTGERHAFKAKGEPITWHKWKWQELICVDCGALGAATLQL